MFSVGVQNPCLAKHAAEVCSPLQFSQKNRKVPQESTESTGGMGGGGNGRFLIISVFPPLVYLTTGISQWYLQ